MSDEAELIRARMVDPYARPRSGAGAPTFAGRVVSTGGTLAVGNYVEVQPFAVLGTEAEGGGATLVDQGPTQAVYWLGPVAPATGDLAVCVFEGNRWVAKKGNAGGNVGPGWANIPGCSCTTIPLTLYLTATGPCDAGTFQGCTLQYGPTPTDLSNLGLGANCFLSVGSYADPFTGTLFRYNLECNTVYFQLSRIYLASGLSGPYHDSTIYSWAVGLSGNSCMPFYLANGYIYAGGNPACIVVISE